MTQEKKNKQLLISLMVLAIATAVLYFTSFKRERIRVDKNLFRIEDLKSIDKVLLESNHGKVELAYNGSRWQVNNTFDADRNLIQVLFATLQQAEPKRPVAAALQDSISDALEKNGVHVSLFAANTRVKNFIASGNSSKTQAFFKNDQDKRSYVMTIPGYRVYVSGIFELGPNDWRDKRVFAFNWRNFKSLKVEFPARPAEDFQIAMNGGQFGIEGISQIDTTKLDQYLDRVLSLTVNQYDDSKKLADSLAKIRPVIILTVEDIGNRAYRVALFQPDASGRMIGLLSNEQIAFFQRQKIDPLLRPKSFFSKH